MTSGQNTYTLDQVVPWGRRYDEYVHMFNLSDEDLTGSILGCGDGPASFNAECSAQGGQVISVDPLYKFTRNQIRARVNAAKPKIIETTRQHLDDFHWDYFPNLDALIDVRLQAMECFLEDYDKGKGEGRYLPASASSLPFSDKTFDLALCSHFLLLYSQQLDYDFHLSALMELKRVSRQVRVFPLLDLEANQSAHLVPLMETLSARGYNPHLQTVPYEFLKGGNQMLVF